MQQLIRVPPNLPVSAYKTFQIAAPRSTHFRAATCEEFDCERARNGWLTILDESIPAHHRTAEWIRRHSGRQFKVERTRSGLTRFEFPPGQDCFDSGKHQVRLDRPPRFLVRPGDWRALGAPRKHTRPEHWVEEMAEDLDQHQTRKERG